MEYNCRLYAYPSGNHVTVYKKTITRQEKDTGIINQDGNGKQKNMDKNAEQESRKKKNENFTKSHVDENRTEEAEEHSKNVSLSATKNRIYNIARSNVWEWFITLTFDRNKVESSDYDIVIYKLHKFLSNLQQRKCPDMKYLIVPELHKDGEHYHFHGLISNVDNLRFCFSGHFDEENNPVYNILDWSYGFTTATRIQDSQRASSYITKYVTKDTDQKLKHKKRYMCSRNVDRVVPDYLIVDEEEFLGIYGKDITYAKNVKVPVAYQSINYYEIKD